jgi:hypothetical protein
MDDLKFSEAFAQFLVSTEVLTPDEALQALDLQRAATPAIGRLALEKELLTMKQVFAILSEQADSGTRFGEQAVELGYLGEDDVTGLLAEQRRLRPGLSAILHDMGALTKRDLQKHRRAFLRQMETSLV